MTEFISVQQAASLLQVTDRTIINLITRGRFPGAYQIDPGQRGSTWRIPRPAIDEYIRKQQPQATNESI